MAETINRDLLRVLETIVAAWKSVPETEPVPEEINVNEMWDEAERVIAAARGIDTAPLLRLLKAQAHGEMLSRHFLNCHDIPDDVIAEAERRGEVRVGEGGTFASVMLAADGIGPGKESCHAD